MNPPAVSPELEAWLVDHLDHHGTNLGAGYQATVKKLDSPAGVIVVKSPHRGRLLSALARRAIRREAGVYARLHGIAGIPRSHGLACGMHLVLEYVPGQSLRDSEDALANREAFFASLLETILAMHAAGVAHGDLKRKDNIIVTRDGRACIIDFGIARERTAGLLGRYLFDVVRQMDLNAWIKLKHGRRPAGLPAEDARYYRPLLIERVARWVRIPWQKLTLRRPRQRWREQRREKARDRR